MRKKSKSLSWTAGVYGSWACLGLRAQGLGFDC